MWNLGVYFRICSNAFSSYCGNLMNFVNMFVNEFQDYELALDDRLLRKIQVVIGVTSRCIYMAVVLHNCIAVERVYTQG